MDITLPYLACHSSHPRHQRGWRGWRCPLCDAPLARDLTAADAAPQCPKLHSDDVLACTRTGCPFHHYGNWCARHAATRTFNTACTHCAGRGYLSPAAADATGKTSRPSSKRPSTPQEAPHGHQRPD